MKATLFADAPAGTAEVRTDGIAITVNNTTVEARPGETILEVLNRNGIHVPTLCHLKGMLPSGACRMCVVENRQNGKLVPSCSYPAEKGMVLATHSPRVIEARRTIVELLLSNHPDDCLYCIRNGNCELQSLSENLNVRERKIRGEKNRHHLDRSSLSLTRDPAKCILCGRCVRVCEEVMGVSAIDFTHRGSATLIGTAFNRGLNTSSCVNCGQCIMVCPTGALSERVDLDEVMEALVDPELTVVVQYAPAISVSIAEEFGMPAGRDVNGLLNTALRMIGFKKVFDTTLSADLTIMEESAELIHRIQNGGVLPMITSCCPGWTKFAEQYYPELLPHLSSCKSPQQMLGAMIKSYWAGQENIDPGRIFTVSVMPCSAKKFESKREEMHRQGLVDVDAVITTRELVRLIRQCGIDLERLQPEATDSPLGTRSTAGKLFGASGGVMEAAIRTAHKTLTGKEMERFAVPAVRGLKGIKRAVLPIDGLEVGVAVVSGLANARQLLEEVESGNSGLHFIEIMACPGGCIAGGGQPIGAPAENIVARMQSLYDIDERDSLKVSHKNPEVVDLYRNFLGEPLGHKSHELLHTHYSERKVLK
jgi:iron-only hydrogenase group A